jgi:hypothetical protein
MPDAMGLSSVVFPDEMNIGKNICSARADCPSKFRYRLQFTQGRSVRNALQPLLTGCLMK